MKNRTSLFLAALVAFLCASCETTEVVQKPVPDPHDHGNEHGEHAKPLPRLSWALHPAGRGYDLDLMVGGAEEHVASGGEYMRGRSVSRSSRDVPSGTASAYEVLLPDGEIDLYWVEEGREGTLLVYRKSYDAEGDSWSSERRLRSISY